MHITVLLIVSAPQKIHFFPTKTTIDDYTSLQFLLCESSAAAAKRSGPEEYYPSPDIFLDFPEVITFHLIRADKASDKEIENSAKCQSHDCAGENDDVVWHAKVWCG